MEIERMALWPRRRIRAPEIKDSRAQTLVALTTAGRPVWTPRDYECLAREGFAKNPVAYRCIRMIAEAAASAPLVVFHEGRRVADHPLQRLMQIDEDDDGALISTTSAHLARAIGKAVGDAWKGELDLDPKAEAAPRVRWQR